MEPYDGQSSPRPAEPTVAATRRKPSPRAWGTCFMHIVVAMGLTALSLIAIPRFADIGAAAADDPEAVHPLTRQMLAHHPQGYLLAGGVLTGLALLKAVLIRSRGLGFLLNIIFVLLAGAWLALLVAGLYLPILAGIDRAISDTTAAVFPQTLPRLL